MAAKFWRSNLPTALHGSKLPTLKGQVKIFLQHKTQTEATPTWHRCSWCGEGAHHSTILCTWKVLLGMVQSDPSALSAGRGWSDSFSVAFKVLHNAEIQLGIQAFPFVFIYMHIYATYYEHWRLFGYQSSSICFQHVSVCFLVCLCFVVSSFVQLLSLEKKI